MSIRFLRPCPLPVGIPTAPLSALPSSFLLSGAYKKETPKDLRAAIVIVFFVRQQ